MEIAVTGATHPAYVDVSDYETVARHRWHVQRSDKGVEYAKTNIPRGDGRQTTLTMHKLLTGYDLVDHINHDGLDNTRSNLREVTTAQSAQNRRKKVGTRSRYIGVSEEYSHGRFTGRWKAMVWNGETRKQVYLGLFDAEEEAARARDAKAIELFGEFAKLNFQEVGTTNG